MSKKVDTQIEDYSSKVTSSKKSLHWALCHKKILRMRDINKCKKMWILVARRRALNSLTYLDPIHKIISKAKEPLLMLN